MSFAALLTHTVTVSRLAASSGIKKSYQQVAIGVACLIQPLDPEASRQANLTYGRAFKGFFLPTADIREGDKLTDHQSRSLTVVGIRHRDYGGLQHKDVLLDQDAAN